VRGCGLGKPSQRGSPSVRANANVTTSHLANKKRVNLLDVHKEEGSLKECRRQRRGGRTLAEKKGCDADAQTAETIFNKRGTGAASNLCRVARPSPAAREKRGLMLAGQPG